MLHERPASRLPSMEACDLLVVAMPLVAEPDELMALEQLLAADERARMARLMGAIRSRFVIGRGRLRRLLAHLLDAQPEAVEFAYGRWGKPCLAGRLAGRLHFNLSHSGNIALVALCADRPVGIDIEVSLPMYTVEWSEQMAPSILAPGEIPAWRRLPDGVRSAALLEAWVAKEAILKAIGCGIGGGLNRVCLPLGDAFNAELTVPWRCGPVAVEVAACDARPGGNVAVFAVDAGPGMLAAVACHEGMGRVVCVEFDQCGMQRSH